MKFKFEQQDELDKMINVYNPDTGKIERVTIRDLIYFKALLEVLDEYSDYTLEDLKSRVEKGIAKWESLREI